MARKIKWTKKKWIGRGSTLRKSPRPKKPQKVS